MDQFSAVKQRGDRTDVPGFLDFSVAVSTAGRTATVRVTGELDCSTAAQLRAALLDVVDGGAREVTLDVSGTHFIDSTGLSVLVGGLKRLREHGGHMVVQSPNHATRRLLDMTGLSTVFDIR